MTTVWGVSGRFRGDGGCDGASRIWSRRPMLGRAAGLERALRLHVGGVRLRVRHALRMPRDAVQQLELHVVVAHVPTEAGSTAAPGAREDVGLQRVDARDDLQV